MPAMQTARFGLPFLAVSQAQKEITHNEALALIDALLHPVAQSELSAPPATTDADIGKCWLIGTAATGEWAAHEGQLACWTGGGWRYSALGEGSRIRLLDISIDRFRSGGQWRVPPAIAEPVGGTVIDTEARLAIGALLSYFRTIGTVAP